MASTLIRTSDTFFQQGFHAGNMLLLTEADCDLSQFVRKHTEKYVQRYRDINHAEPPARTARYYAAGLLQAISMRTRK